MKFIKKIGVQLGIPLLLAGVAFLLLLPACQKEVFTTSASDKLSFSTDTLRFDTVFTELGSATRILKAYNSSNKSILISNIYLELGAQSKYRINVDGLPGTTFTDIEIAPKDSLYIFAEVTIDPDAPLSASPFVVEEQLVFETNGNTQTVLMESFGQNANYIPSRFFADSISLYDCGGDEWVWDDPRPYVVYGVVVFSNCTVRMPAGTRVYVHGGLARIQTDSTPITYNDGFLAFQENATLIVDGTEDNPVIFEGDRIESEFDAVPGQWTGLWLQSGQNHRLKHCTIRNSIVGIRVDSAVSVRLENTQIYNTTSSGLLAIHANVIAQNCLFYKNTGFSIQLEYGGNYDFSYCTATSYGVSGDALRMTNVLCGDGLCESFEINPLNASFKNCILMGGRKDQIALFDRTEGGNDFDYSMTNCITKADDILDANQYPDFFDFCNPCLNALSTDTIFVDIDADNFRLDTFASIANNYGVPLPLIDTDLEGKMRDPVQPDAGCYENEF